MKKLFKLARPELFIHSHSHQHFQHVSNQVIDFDALALRRPFMAHDLPGGARRLLQRADGYHSKIVRGEVVMRDGEPTGAMPGRLLRGSQPAPLV